MKLIRTFVTVLVMAAVAGTAAAQTPTPVPAPPGPLQNQPAPPEGARPPDDVQPLPSMPAPEDFERITFARPVVRIGTPFTLGPEGAVREVTVVMSDATIAGRVLGDVVVVLGNLRLQNTAVVEGAVVVVGGHATVVQGASIQRDFVIVGGGLDAPVDFVPQGQQVLVGPPALGSMMREVAPWFTRGLLWGRVIVPDLGWIWSIVGIVLLVNLAIAFAFPAAVHATVETLSARPVGSILAGLITLLLFAPAVTILAISVIGIIVIPFLTCAVIAGWMIGKVAVAAWIGRGILHQDDPDSRGQTVRSMAIGFALIVLTYMIPVLGLAAWASVGVLGLGTATLTLMASMKRERPLPPPQPVGSSSAAPGPPAPPAPLSVPADAVPMAEAYVPPAAASFQPPVPPPVSAVPLTAGTGPADLTAFPRATFMERLGAAALDLIVVGIGYNLFDWWDDDRAFFVILVAYHIVFWTLKGTTLGGMILNLRVVRTDGSAVTPSDAVVRGLTSLLSFFALGLGFLWILRDPERQAWHDRVAGTYVVTVPRNWPLP